MAFVFAYIIDTEEERLVLASRGLIIRHPVKLICTPNSPTFNNFDGLIVLRLFLHLIIFIMSYFSKTTRFEPIRSRKQSE